MVMPDFMQQLIAAIILLVTITPFVHQLVVPSLSI